MTLEQIVTLSFIQGLTEFLPISSSAHLVLVPALFGWQDQGLMMDVAAHVGTLGSVLVYFRKDVWALFKGFLSFLKGEITDDTRLLFNLIIATIPVVFVGLFFDKVVGDAFRSIPFIAWMAIIFGIILYLTDKCGNFVETVADTTLTRALYFGLAQCIALFQGVSRAGACFSIGRYMNYKRTEVARFAFLMAIPTMTAAGTLKGYQLFKENDLSMLNDAALMAAFSFVFGFCAIAFMMRWLAKSTLTPFVIYRILLGVILLIGSGIGR